MSDVLRVAQPGPFTTVQDLGRPHAIRSGVPPGGAMDRFALMAANLLVGNPTDSAALECAIAGPALVALDACLIAVTGADFGLLVNDAPAPAWTGIFLGPGDGIAFAGRTVGARAYIAVAGGLDSDKWLGSRSTYLPARRGGIHGRILEAGDTLSTATAPARPLVSGRHLPARLRPDYSNSSLGVIAGPHIGRLDKAGRAALFAERWTVTRDADRMGYRLQGPHLELKGDELLSFGLVAGAVQVPYSGQPILLMADHQTAGGYPVVACVVTAELPKAAQLLPGDTLSFREVSLVAAREMRARLETSLTSIR
jgi:antagonist of KipI